MLRKFLHQISYKIKLIHLTQSVPFYIWLFRCQDAEAFELSSSGFTNGVFIKFLKKRLLDDEKITVVLDKVAEGERAVETQALQYAVKLIMKIIVLYSLIVSNQKYHICDCG